MLTHTVSRALYSRFAGASADYLASHLSLVGKAALMIYRKCGAEEARVFIGLMRAALIWD